MREDMVSRYGRVRSRAGGGVVGGGGRWPLAATCLHMRAAALTV